MRAGNLDRIIELQRRSTGIDAWGTPIDVWTTFATMRAQLLQNATDDREGPRGKTTNAVLTFRTRWVDGVTLENRVVYQGSQLTISQTKEVGRRVGLELTCERVGK
ncbi:MULTISPECIES: head-tail adaptor protein [unclassified Bradyrhizobium]|uniref:head-tail adaptor protein n=1 Tax=unclassified Bradyrhizobium TaxID=2631580 RepID=UPI0029162B72|nr:MULTISPECIES: head-tail adaptor protein [unclassified Bradyrhizobium]